jgi:hypothetical protein
MKPQISITHKGNLAQVEFTGTLTIKYASLIANGLRSIKSSDVQIYLTKPDAIDLSFIQMLHAFMQHYRAKENTLKISADLNEKDLALLKTTGFHSLLFPLEFNSLNN